MKLKYSLLALLLTPALSFASVQLSCGPKKDTSSGMAGATQSCIYNNGSLLQAFYAFGSDIELWQPLMSEGLQSELDFSRSYGNIEVRVKWWGRDQFNIIACEEGTDYCANANFQRMGNRVVIKAEFS